MTINLTPFLFLIAGVSINPKSATTPPPAILPIAANPALSLASFASVIPCDVEALFCVVGLKYTKRLGEPCCLVSKFSTLLDFRKVPYQVFGK